MAGTLGRYVFRHEKRLEGEYVPLKSKHNAVAFVFEPDMMKLFPRGLERNGMLRVVLSIRTGTVYLKEVIPEGRHRLFDYKHQEVVNILRSCKEFWKDSGGYEIVNLINNRPMVDENLAGLWRCQPKPPLVTDGLSRSVNVVLAHPRLVLDGSESGKYTNYPGRQIATFRSSYYGTPLMTYAGFAPELTSTLYHEDELYVYQGFNMVFDFRTYTWPDLQGVKRLSIEVFLPTSRNTVADIRVYQSYKSDES